MKQKYLLVTSNKNDNIGVLECDNEFKFENATLEKLLSDEFGDDIDVNSVEEIRTHPCKLVAKCSNSEFDMFNIDLNETWVY